MIATIGEIVAIVHKIPNMSRITLNGCVKYVLILLKKIALRFFEIVVSKLFLLSKKWKAPQLPRRVPHDNCEFI